MPAFLVHGVPNTHQMWDGVRQHLTRSDIIAPDMPGFGCDTPAGFTCTKEEYVDWLIGKVEAVGEPVDMVGHDWGALLTARLVQVRPDLVRTWAIGGAAIDKGYTWHPVAKMWQTPEMGEQVIAGMTPDAFATLLIGEGVPEDAAGDMGSRLDARMGAAILPLYRSAVNYMTEWHADVEGMKQPGLLIWGETDPYMQLEFAKKMAARANARLVTLPGSHWWPAQFPKESAGYLEEFWG